MNLSVIIVNYNVRFFLEQCLQSVYQSGKSLKMEVFVVDNNSVDGSVDMVREKFPQVRLIANEQNVGFSQANNQAIKQAMGKYVLLLNPDTVLENDTLPSVIEFMESHSDAGGLGVKMLDGQGRFLPESKRGLPTPGVAFCKIFGLSALFPKSKRFGRYHLGYLDQDQVHKVDVLSGAFMLLRNETLQKTGLLDESFFMYGEDIDLSYRITQAGYNNYYFPRTRIIHYKGESTKKSSINYVFVFYNAMIIFARKHFSPKNARLFSLLINMAVYFRAFIAIVVRFFKRLAWPIVDAATIYAGMYLIKEYWEHQVLMAESTYYPPLFMSVVVPGYIGIWLLAIYLGGGYDPPRKMSRLVRGIAAGTLAILVIYALLPTELRFSRALILLGSAWAVFATFMTRNIYHLIKNKRFTTDDTLAKRALVVGDGPEARRIISLLRSTGHIDFTGLASLQHEKPHDQDFLGTISQIDEIIDIYRINEVIFCAADMSSETIISQMSALAGKEVTFKIAPPESLYIIGSNSIEAFGDVFTISVNAINNPGNRRLKRLVDLFICGMVLIGLPIHLLFVRKRKGLIRNLFLVLSGSASWVGYHPATNYQSLPKIKNGILYPDDMLKNKDLPPDTIQNLNKLYAKDYKPENDLRITMIAYRCLGRDITIDKQLNG